jgi:fructose-1,6-bisphosphatase
VEEARPINESADFIIEKLKQHLEHYSDISTILTLIERMDDEDPKLIEALQQYPQHAVDAGWAVYSKALSAALVVTTEALGEAMVRYNEDDTDLLSSHRQSNVAALQVKVDLLLHKLEAVRIRSEQSRKQSV